MPDESAEPANWGETLTQVMIELEEARQRAVKDAFDLATQVLINYAALAEFARPQNLPPFQRFLKRDPRSNTRYPINGRSVTPLRPAYRVTYASAPPLAQLAPRPAPRPTPPRNPDGTWRRDELPYS